MKITGKVLCLISGLLFIVVAIYTQSVVISNKNDGIMVCSTKGIMRFENMTDENVNANIHFNFSANGKAL